MMSRRRLARTALVVCVLLYCATALAATWRTTRFEVYRGDPHAGMFGWETIEAVTPQNPLLLRDVYVREIENYLYAVARRYEALGFPDPVAEGVLHSLVTRDDGAPAIRVYLSNVALTPENRNAKAWYVAQPCGAGGSRGLIFLNLTNGNFAAGSRLNDSDYVTLAHELFHAVHQATVNGRTWGCRFGERWFSEGMSDAIGTYMARTLRNTRFDKELAGTGYLQIFGNRYYSFPLSQPVKRPGTGAQDYYTSSFWRHLAEWSHASRQGKPHPGSAPQLEDYAYLVTLLGEPYTFGVDREGLISWLDSALRRNPQIRAGLAAIFPQFVSTHGHIIETRLPSLARVPNAAKMWVARTFGECTDAGALGPGSSQAVRLSIRANAARCILTDVQADVTQREVAIQVTHDDKSLLKQLVVSRLDGTDVRSPLIHSRIGGQPPHAALWHFPIVSTGEDRFVVSNVAADPAATRAFEGDFHLATGTFTSSLFVGPLPLPPGPYLPPPGSQPPTRKDRQKAAFKKVVDQPLENLQTLVKVKRQQAGDGPVNCDPARRRRNLCGPQLRITMELSPFASMRALAGSGRMGEVDAVIDAGKIGADGGAGFTARYKAAIQETEEALAAMDGARIRLSLPRIDYGFTGSKDNVGVEVTKANSPGRGYVAHGPSIRAGGRVLHRPPNGRVTIEEFSLHRLRGSFSADLIDASNPGTSDAPIVARSVSGRFDVPSPVAGDEAFAIDRAHQQQVLLQSMQHQAPFGAAAMRGLMDAQGAPTQALCDAGVDDDALLAMGFSRGCGGTPAQICTCDCAQREMEAGRCAGRCDRQWRRCPVADSEVPDDFDAQVERCRSALVSRGVPASQLETMLGMFRAAPAFQRREMLKARWCGP